MFLRWAYSQSSRQRVLTPHALPHVQVWTRHHQPAFTHLFSQGYLAYKGAPLELLGKANFLYNASLCKHLFEGI